MKVIKQKHHAISPTHYCWQGKYYYSFGVLQLFDLQNSSTHFNQLELWTLNSKVLDIMNGELFDIGIPKKHAEFLATGFCFPPGGSAAKSYVRISLAEKEKTLAIFGNREWQEVGITARQTPPETFNKMPLTYQQAFGGIDYAANPLGKGIGMVEPDDPQRTILPLQKKDLEHSDFPQQDVNEETDASYVALHTFPLPNVEYPDQLILSRGDRPKPASFYLIDQINPQRLKKFGHPGINTAKDGVSTYPKDLDWRYFNVAADDQQSDKFFTGDESFCIENMHPEQSVIRGELPGWKVRCFAQKKRTDAENSYQEIPVNLDTIWFIPERMRGVMVWHGIIEVADELASDLIALQIEDEKLYDKPKATNEYYQRFLEKTKRETLEERKEKQAQEIEKKKQDVLAKAKKNLPNSKIFNDPKIQEALAKAKPVSQQIFQEANQGLVTTRQAPINTAMPNLDPQSLLAHMLTKVDKPEVSETDVMALNPVFQMAGLGEYDKSSSLTNNLKALFKNAKTLKLAQLQSCKAEIEKTGQTIDSIFAKKPPKIDVMAMRQEIQKIYNAAKSNDPKLDKQLADQFLAKGLPNLNSDFEAFLAKQKFPTLFTREDLEEAYANGESLEGQRFFELDLSGINLSGANLKGSYFLHCNIQHANFSKANLTQTNFAGTDLTYANLSETNCFNSIFQAAILDNTQFQQADLSMCELSESSAKQADFSNANLQQSKISKADWAYANLSQVKANAAIFRYSQFTHANLTGIDLSQANIISCEFSNVALQQANLRRALVKNVRLEKLALSGIDIEKAMFSDLEVSHLSFNKAKLNKVKFNNCQFAHVEFNNSEMEQFCLTNCQVKQAQFYDCVLTGFQAITDTKLEEITFKKCNIAKSNWMGAIVWKASFYRCNLNNTMFDNASVRESEFLYCQAKHTRFINADLGESKFYWTNLIEAVLRNAKIEYTNFSHCNLYRVDFLHAHTQKTVVDACLLQDPLPKNFEDGFIHG